MMPPPPDPLTDREWRALADALRDADPVAREALARLMRHHGVDDRLTRDATPDRTDALTAPRPQPGVIPGVIYGAPDPAGARDWARPTLHPPGAGPAGHDDAAARAGTESSGGSPDPRDGDPAWRLEPSFRFEPGDDADDLNFEAVVPGRQAPHWELTGPFADLNRAAEIAGLDANAIRYASEGPEGDGTIIHPSPFCEDPETFLSLLAILARSTPHVRLYRIGRRDTGSVAVLVRVFPNPDPDTMAILDAFDPQGAEAVRKAGVAVADALAYLDDRATG